jgi:hypothetical protein
VKRILSIDGGGIRGIFPASFLATVEEAIGCSVADYFDLVVGTSTGGIIGLGLGLGWPAARIAEFYDELGPSVFAGNRLVRFLRHLGSSKYDSAPLRRILEQRFGDKVLGDSARRLVIPSLNLETGEVHVFKTAHHPRLELDYKQRAVDVALATAAAPTYFPTHRLTPGIPLIDGGVWANNPIVVGIVEAYSVLGWPLEEISILSLGCTSPPFDMHRARFRPLGRLYWAFKVADVFMAGQASGALGIAGHLVGKENVFRISPVTPAGRYGLDSLDSLWSLRGLGVTEARKALPNLRQVFFQKPAERFVPFHKSEGVDRSNG